MGKAQESNMIFQHVGKVALSDFILAEIKPAFEKGKIKEAGDLHEYLWKFIDKWNDKCKREGTAPPGVEQAAFDIQEHGWMLQLILSMRLEKFTFGSLNAYYDASKMILDEEIDRVNKILTDLKENYRELNEFEEIGE